MNSCFVAMPFHQPLDAYYHKIFSPAIEGAGMVPTRGDSIFAAGDIVGQVVTMIRESSIVLAELSQINANVYYEVGIAHVLRKPTVLITQNVATVPFDLRGGRVIAYSLEDPFWGEALQTSITRSLLETIKDPAGSLPPGLAMALGGFTEPIPEEGAESAVIRDIESRLSQMQRALEISSRRAPAISPESLAQAESARETIRVLLAQGFPAAEVIAELRRVGVSELWAEVATKEEQVKSSERRAGRAL